MFFFLKALISERYVMLLAGRWWKLAYRQIHGNGRTKAQSAKACKKRFLRFLFKIRGICEIRKICVRLKKKRMR